LEGSRNDDVAGIAHVPAAQSTVRTAIVVKVPSALIQASCFVLHRTPAFVDAVGSLHFLHKEDDTLFIPIRLNSQDAIRPSYLLVTGKKEVKRGRNTCTST